MPQMRLAAENRLLAALPRQDLKRVLSRCEQVNLCSAQTLGQPGERILDVYFPLNSSISLMNPIAQHASLEIALVGNEGMTGLPLMLGVATTPMLSLVQGSGAAWRMDAAVFCRELDHSKALRLRLNCYLHVIVTQLAQMVSCTRLHVVEARLARWLLMSRDRSQVADLRITHESLAHILGVRRAGVTRAAGSLQKRRIIRYSRGYLRILDLHALEAAACPCYAIDNESYDKILSRGESVR